MGAAKRPASFRTDPKPRATDGVSRQTDVLDRDPARFYVLVNETNHGTYDVDYYLSLAEGLELPEDEGYRVEKYTGPKGTRLRIGNTSRQPGDTIRYRGMVLMSCPVEFKRLLDEVGADGQSGQRDADETEDKVRRNGNIADDLTGVSVVTRNGTRYIRPMKETELET